MAPQVGTIGRTFRAVFELPVLKKEYKAKKAKKSINNLNPVCLAMAWRERIKNGECSSQADLARRLRVSRTRVCQVLRFLRLDPEVLNCIATLGDPLSLPIATERRLKELVNLPVEEQRQRLEAILLDSAKLSVVVCPRPLHRLVGRRPDFSSLHCIGNHAFRVSDWSSP